MDDMQRLKAGYTSSLVLMTPAALADVGLRDIIEQIG
jgi:hypothetical protein